MEATDTATYNNIDCNPKDWFISNEHFEQVRITEVEDYNVWVQKANAFPKIRQLSNTIKAHIKNQIPIQPCASLKCVAEYEGLWYRMLVKKIFDESMEVFLIDFGLQLEISKSKVFSIEGFEDIGFYCQKISFDKHLNINFEQIHTGDIISVRATGINSAGVLMVEVEDDIWCAGIRSGSEVKVVEFISQTDIYVQSIVAEETKRRQRLEQEITKYSLNQKPLQDLPVVGQLVMAPYDDGKYYRAQILTIKGKTNIRIRYIDYGNEDNVAFEQLFELSNELKKERACVVRIKLMDVEDDTPMTEDAAAYLIDLIAREVVLTCYFTDSPTIDGVALKTPGNGNDFVNDQITALLKPTSKKVDEEKLSVNEILMIDQLPTIKLGNVGDRVEATVLCYYESCATVVLAPNDKRILKAFEGRVNKRIQAYVKNTPHHYIPKERELCFALYNDFYYRGVCVISNENPGESSRILFVDVLYEALVKHEDIRMMTKEFLDLESLAIPCRLSPLVPAEELTDEVSQRLRKILAMNKVINLKIVSEDRENGMPWIDIPKLRKKLCKWPVRRMRVRAPSDLKCRCGQ